MWVYLYSNTIINLGYNQSFCVLNLCQSDKQMRIHSYFQLLDTIDAKYLCRFNIHFMFLLKWIVYLSPLHIFLLKMLFSYRSRKLIFCHDTNAFPQFIIWFSTLRFCCCFVFCQTLKNLTKTQLISYDF